MSIRHGPYPSRSDFVKSPEELAREQFRAESMLANKTQRASLHDSVLAGLQSEASKVPKNLRGRLPQIHGQMSGQDATAAMRSINIALARPPDFNFINNPAPVSAPPRAVAAPAVAPAPSPNAPAAISRAATNAGNAASTTTGRSPLDALSATMATEGKLAKGTKIANTGGGMQVAATRPDGTPMTNPDGSPRYVSFQPSAHEALVGHFGDAWINATPAQRNELLKTLPAGNRGETIDPGATPFNSRGESTVQTPRGSEVAVDPSKDLSKTWLPKGDPLVGGADRGVAIEEKYRTPGASPIGTGTGGNNWITRADVALAETSAPVGAPTATPMLTANPAAGHSMTPTGASAGTMANPVPPSRSQFLTGQTDAPAPAAQTRFDVPPTPTPGSPITLKQDTMDKLQKIGFTPPPAKPQVDLSPDTRRKLQMSGFNLDDGSPPAPTYPNPPAPPVGAKPLNATPPPVRTVDDEERKKKLLTTSEPAPAYASFAGF